ncbi:DUF6049 family protein [Myceligenerans pegani]|uniref:Secreted protein n=1 Tax=Myceligenerans pegani TaxID=2776917 RepID=A0ABR9N336_9MICO|nr:DUF6049 family protein [Myceligenerans sp. TRM 65318]MBE1877523.1 hypothetical protein [Myceligenerans sp. TRM 65318]MBE3019794.1 hypothetical protein [Myceligenerans sp. TRM 65318]
MTQHHGARRRRARTTAGILTTCLTLLGGFLPASAISGAAAASPVATAGAPRTTAASAPVTTAASSTRGTTFAVVRDRANDVVAPVTVDLDSVSPTVARPGDEVRIAVRVTNTTDQALEGLTARVAVNAAALTQRSMLSAWESLALTDRVGTSGPSGRDLGRLGPGQSTSLQLTFPTAVYTLQGWGPRELSVEIHDASARVGVLRTFLMYDDGVTRAGQAPMRLTVAAPVTTGIVDPADLEGAQLRLAQEAAEEGRLDQMLRVARTGDVSLAVDPNVMGLAVSAEDDQLRLWGSDFLDATEATSTFALPAWDPDIGALTHADVSRGRMRGFLNTPVIDGWKVPKSWGEGLAWPARGVADRVTVAGATYADRPNVILANGTFAPTTLGVAESRADVDLKEGTARTAVADATLTRVFTDGTDLAPALRAAESTEADDSGAGEASRTTTPVLTSAAAAQRMLAETSAIVAQSADPPHALVALDRSWYPDAGAVDAILGVLNDAAWVEPAPLDELLASDASPVARTPLPYDEPAKRDLAAHEVARIDETRTGIIDFSSIADDPAELRQNSLWHLVTPLSVAYRADPEQRQVAVDEGIAYTQDVLDAVAVIPREGINLISDRGNLPIRVRNGLDTAVTVTVRLRPDNPRLTVEHPVSGTIPSGKEMDLPIPVEAIGSGDVTVTAELVAPSGVRLGSDTSFEVRVRAGWEEVGTWIAAGLVGLLFLAGIWRTVRRGRSPNRATVEDVEAATGEIEATAGSTDAAGPTTAAAAARRTE